MICFARASAAAALFALWLAVAPSGGADAADAPADANADAPADLNSGAPADGNAEANSGAGAGPAADAPADPVGDAIALGRRIYFEGEGRGEGEITAMLGAGGFTVPAAAVPCSNCHGDDALGRPEGGVEPTNITWPFLTKPYGLRHASGRRHPAYDEASFARALREGIDPAGNRLDGAMPRYTMSNQELDALVAYLKRLGEDRDPGLTDAEIRIGGILPDTDVAGGLGAALAELLEAYFARVNEAGGIYDRRIAFSLVDTPDAPAAPAPASASASDPAAADPSVAEEGTEQGAEEGAEQGYFAAIALPASAPTRQALQALSTAMPVVVPVDLSSQALGAGRRNVFQILAPVAEQARALMSYGQQYLQLDAPRIAVVAGDGSGGDAVVAAAEAQARALQWPEPLAVRAGAADDAAALAQAVEAGAVDAVVYAAPAPSVAEFAAEIAAAGEAPHLLIVGQTAGSDVLRVPGAFASRVVASFANTPSSTTSEGLAELDALRRAAAIEQPANAVMAATLSGAKVLVESIRGAGRGLNRRKVADALQGLHLFETGLTPAVSFGPRRRVGADGVYVLAVDPINRSFLPGAAWIRVDR
jgi:ABC-type branched-subunit amino acid transport system substrate-binding protein